MGWLFACCSGSCLKECAQSANTITTLFAFGGKCLMALVN
nr:MAG TPA: hypothetical protein [Caudoviricetes sp.]